jgi:hypothetical protein
MRIWQVLPASSLFCVGLELEVSIFLQSQAVGTYERSYLRNQPQSKTNCLGVRFKVRLNHKFVQHRASIPSGYWLPGSVTNHYTGWLQYIAEKSRFFLKLIANKSCAMSVANHFKIHVPNHVLKTMLPLPPK